MCYHTNIMMPQKCIGTVSVFLLYWLRFYLDTVIKLDILNAIDCFFRLYLELLCFL